MQSPWLNNHNSNIRISVVTDPISIYVNIFLLFHYWKFRIRQIMVKKIYGGHYAVTRSLISGLINNKINYSYNPDSLEDLSSIVIVLSNKIALQQMISLKKKGKILRLYAGPNIFENPISYGNDINLCYLDGIITPSIQVKELTNYIYPQFSDRCLVWPAGVDTDFWVPSLIENEFQVLFYIKDPSWNRDLRLQLYDYLKEKNIIFTEIIYGSYSSSIFLDLLHKSKLMIAFTRSESQGIAFAEAWSCNVPTFVFKNIEPVFQGINYNGNNCPYLNDSNGLFFTNFESFTYNFDLFCKGNFTFEPRKWCLKNMSDSVSVNNLLNKITI